MDSYNKTDDMSNFQGYFNNDSQRYFFESRYEGVSEPLKEYNVGVDGSLYETPTSETLLGVKKNGKWGWVDANNMLVIQPVYDSGFVTCYNGIIILTKNGYWGGVYRVNESIAFSFIYSFLNHAYRETYIAGNNCNKYALVKPGDMMLTNYSYIGISIYNRGAITEYVETGLYGESRGYIDLETGTEL